MPEDLAVTVAVHEDRLSRAESELLRMREKQHEHGNKLAVVAEVKENFDRLDRHVRDQGREFTLAFSEIRSALSDIKSKLANYDGEKHGQAVKRSTTMSMFGVVTAVVSVLLALYMFLETHLVSPP
jgi:septation ring formation regulator EzrA